MRSGRQSPTAQPRSSTVSTAPTCGSPPCEKVLTTAVRVIHDAPAGIRANTGSAVTSEPTPSSVPRSPKRRAPPVRDDHRDAARAESARPRRVQASPRARPSRQTRSRSRRRPLHPAWVRARRPPRLPGQQVEHTPLSLARRRISGLDRGTSEAATPGFLTTVSTFADGTSKRNAPRLRRLASSPLEHRVDALRARIWLRCREGDGQGNRSGVLFGRPDVTEDCVRDFRDDGRLQVAFADAPRRSG